MAEMSEQQKEIIRQGPLYVGFSLAIFDDKEFSTLNFIYDIFDVLKEQGHDLSQSQETAIFHEALRFYIRDMTPKQFERFKLYFFNHSNCGK